MRELLRSIGVRRTRLGSSLMRGSLGLCILYEYLSLYTQRHYFWGNNGVWPRVDGGDGGVLSLYELSSQAWYFEVVFHVGVILTMLFAMGVGGRVTTIAVYCLTSSIQNANPLILDGGDNVVRIVLFFMMFSTSRIALRNENQIGGNGASVRGAFHNLAVLAIVVQLCFLYCSTGLYKAMGEMWQSGTALYYILRVHWFSWPGVSDVIYESVYAVVVLTYGTILFEIAFPFLLLNTFTRWTAIGLGISMHVGIALYMGLIGFSWAMISLYFLLLTDDEYERLTVAARKASEKIVALKSARPGDAAGVDVILYDGVCGLCNGFIAFVLKRNETLKISSMQSDVGRRVILAQGRDPERLEAMYVVADYGSSGARCLEGADAVLYTVGRLGVGWRALTLALRVVPRSALNATYRRVAGRRRLFFGSCSCGVEDSRRYGDRVLSGDEEGDVARGRST